MNPMAKRSGEATKRRNEEGKATKKLGSEVSIEAYRLVAVHSLMTGESHAQILDRLILTGLREWHVRANPGPRTGVRPSPADISDRPELADQVIETAAA